MDKTLRQITMQEIMQITEDSNILKVEDQEVEEAGIWINI